MVELWIHRKCAREGDELINDPKQSGDGQCELCTVSAGKVWLHEGSDVPSNIEDVIEEAVEDANEAFSELEALETTVEDAEEVSVEAVVETADATEEAENLTPENDTGEAEEAVEAVPDGFEMTDTEKEHLENLDKITLSELDKQIAELQAKKDALEK